MAIMTSKLKEPYQMFIRAPATRQGVMAWCKKRGISLSVERWNETHHVHADIDAPHSIFRAHELHNLGLWDELTAPNWAEIGRALVDADFGPCTDDDCLYCGGGD